VAASTLGAQRADEAGITLRVPDSIGVFRMLERRDFPDRAQGSMLRYRRADSLTADVFLYAGPDLARECDLACARGVMAREGDDFVGAFPEMVRRKYADTIAVTSDSALTADSAAAWRLGRHLRLFERQAGRERWSDYYLYYLPGFRLKVRATYPPDAALAAAVARFTADAIPAITGQPQGGDAGEDSRGIAVSATLPEPPAALYARVLRKLADLGFAVEDSSLSAGRIVTAPRYTWPLGSEKETWHGAESPGVRLVVSVTAKGDSTAFTVTGQSPTRPEWKDAKTAQMLQILSVTELAAALTDDGKQKGKR
jgi:hypothetical protein